VSPLVTPKQIQALQSTRRGLDIDEEAWRAKLQRISGQESTKGLTSAQAGALLDEMRSGRPATSAAADKVTGTYGGKAKALWISGYYLAVVNDRSDAALIAWVGRQTGYPTLAWVREHGDGVRVIEALKSWLAREAGLDWSTYDDPRWVVLAGIFGGLEDAGVWHWSPGVSHRDEIERWACGSGIGQRGLTTAAHLDEAIRTAGDWLRKTMGRPS